MVSKHTLHIIFNKKKKTNNKHFLSIKKKSHVIRKVNGPSVQVKPLNNKIVINKKALEAFPLLDLPERKKLTLGKPVLLVGHHVSHEKHKIYKLKWQDE